MINKFLSHRASRIAAVTAAGALVLGATVGVSTTAIAASRGHSSHSRSYSAIKVTTNPVIAGTNQVGSNLTYTPAVWAVTPDSVTFQWFRGEHAISGATSSTYTVVSADAGKHISVRETATKAGYNKRTVSSNKIKIASLLSFSELQDVNISGTTVIGSTLTLSAGIYTPAPQSISYQWMRNGVKIVGAIGTSYVLTADDAGQRISVVETVSATGLKTKSESSNRLWVPLVP